MEKKYDGTHFLIMYLTGYGFFIYQVFIQILYSYHGMSLIIPVIIGALLMPLIIFYVIKKLNNNSTLSIKLNFVFTILNIIYLGVIGILTLNYVCVMVHNYYYQSVKSYIIAIFFLIPILYALIKKSKIYYSLSFIMLGVFIIFNLVYAVNHEVAELFPLSNALIIDHPLILTILVIPVVFEPVLLLANNEFIDKSKKINVPLVLIIASFISIVGIYTVIREGMEFGLLLETISFPYFESGKFMSIETDFDNIDYYYLFWVTISIFTRLPMFYFNIKDNFKLKSKGILISFVITIGIFYYLQLRLEFYREIVIPLLIGCSLTLLILFILSLFSKRRLNDVTD